MLINILTPMLYSPPIKISASLHRNLDMLVSSLRSLKYHLVMKQTHLYSISSISLKLLSIGPPRTSMMVVPLQLTCFHATRPLTAFCLNRQLSPFKTLFSLGYETTILYLLTLSFQSPVSALPLNIDFVRAQY